MSARILTIDAGNTRIKWGLHDGREWFLHGAVDTADIAGSQAFREAWQAFRIERVVLSNVAGPTVAKQLAQQIQSLTVPPVFITAEASRCGVVNRYGNPAQLGSDRWSALIAAHVAAASAPCTQLVVMCGTALTVDALTADGRFLGGIIVPGPMLMRRALNSATAQLPLQPGEYQMFPTSTVNAIATGTIEACSGAVQRLYTHLSAQTGAVPHCIGSGGAMQALAPHLPFPVSINDNLVLDGLLAIAQTL